MKSKNYLEREIEKVVCDYAKKLGVLVYKFSSPQHRGVPDRLLVYKGILYLIEFKSKTGILTTLQRLEIQKLREHRIPVSIINDIQNGIKLIDDLVNAGTNK